MDRDPQGPEYAPADLGHPACDVPITGVYGDEESRCARPKGHGSLNGVNHKSIRFESDWEQPHRRSGLDDVCVVCKAWMGPR